MASFCPLRDTVGETRKRGALAARRSLQPTIRMTMPTIAAAVPISMALYQSNRPSMGAHYTRGLACRLVSV
jgi:hypothetical protein